MTSLFSRHSRCGWLVAVLACPFATGCGAGDDGGVKTYKVAAPDDKAKPEEKGGEAKLPAGHPPVGGPQGGPQSGSGTRILGALYPADNPVWFFKLTGPSDQLEKHAADFEKLTNSVKPQGDAVPAFTLPAGWTLGGPRSVSRGGVTVEFVQTIKLGPPDAPLEVTISRSGGGVMMNVNRWAGQVGVAVRGPADLGKYTKEFTADQVKGIRVDLRQGQ
ncbi:hypothetical protein [Gemmata sp.]|uniref:hypothetical protein n=1 Tax=Gemmata sp. TaxID=1914242 RepID=UPI003F72445E